MFELSDLDIQENESALDLFIKCLEGFFIIIWIAVNFLFQPILLIFWIVTYIPLKILFLIGMNLPGNKFNLTFSYKGKKEYSDNTCALTSVFIVFFLVFTSLYHFKESESIWTSLNKICYFLQIKKFQKITQLFLTFHLIRVNQFSYKNCLHCT